MRVGCDTGGTFTDLVAADGTIAKVASTPDDPSAAVADGLAALGVDRPDALAHGTTVATNALLERRGATVTLVTNEGFADVIEIARQDRPSLYDPFVDRPAPLVDRAHRVEVGGRLDADGHELVPIGPAPALPADTQAVAVCLLHADLNPAHEAQLGDELRAAGHDVTCSHELSPEFREYERTVTTVVNAYLRPLCRDYLQRLAPMAGEVLVMTSAGALVPVDDAASRPAALLLSGPAGGVRAAAEVAAACGWPDAITFDMGGTSTDVCLVRGGVPEPAPALTVAGLPVRLPSQDVHTIGAGGGSIARLDPGGALAVGPRSAGAVPGPACSGRGGSEPTVTDANLVLGRIPEGTRFGSMTLDVAAARRALDIAGVDADAVLRVANAAMEQAMRVVSVERGVDPRGLALVAFGGAGPLHACALAEALDMPCVIVPPRAGVLSAVGMLCGPRQVDRVRSWPTPSTHDGLAEALAELAMAAGAEAGPDAVVTTSLDCRYTGQSHELTVASVDEFAAEHERRNGYGRPETPIEVVALRARAAVSSPVSVTALPPVTRSSVTGPSVVVEADCTVWVADGWVGEPGPGGALILTRSGLP